ncbi:hypothetical protein BP5796_08419 [Coleophoma crateriformis]|uniref:gamma-glutamylcyclotransferase n=1 Tax=Coleophoma crateriformis TaxID=565419 RepID=A0A3D8R7J4_9HELO|nr:hypothetical protein BP5796_08419 [Coleophoma crateriformis]
MPITAPALTQPSPPSAPRISSPAQAAQPEPETEPVLYFAYGSNLAPSYMKTRCPNSAFHSLGYLPDYRWIIREGGFATIFPVETKQKPEVEFKGKGGCLLSHPLDELFPEDEEEVEGEEEIRDVRDAGGIEIGGEEEEEGGEEREGVWGIIYKITPDELFDLDASEDVPRSYAKTAVTVTSFPANPMLSLISNSWHPRAQTSTQVQAYTYTHPIASPSSEREEEEEEEERRVPEGLILHRYIARLNTGIVEAAAYGLPNAYVENVLRRFCPEVVKEEDENVRWVRQGYWKRERYGEEVEFKELRALLKDLGVGEGIGGSW